MSGGLDQRGEVAVRVLAQRDAHERQEADEGQGGDRTRPDRLQRGSQPVGDERGDRDRDVERHLGVERPRLRDRYRRRAEGEGLGEREDREDLPPLRLGPGPGGVVRRRADRAVEAEAQQDDRGDEVEDRHDAQHAVARIAPHGRPLGAEHERPHERPRDEISREHEERRQREVDARDRLLGPAVARERRGRLGVGEDVRDEDERHADAAESVPSEQVPDPGVAGPEVLRVTGHRQSLWSCTCERVPDGAAPAAGGGCRHRRRGASLPVRLGPPHSPA